MDHPNIIKLFEVFEDDENFYLVEELWTGKEVYNFICDNEYLDEPTAAKIFMQMVQVVVYLHENSICHRDLKPENFVLKSNEGEMCIKLRDFNLATCFLDTESVEKNKLKRMKTRAGTAFFMAPEVLKYDYSHHCDIWSLGTILYTMFWGYPPFSGETDSEILDAVSEGTYDLDEDIWNSVSTDAKDLISKMLVPEANRISMNEVLDHPWTKKYLENNSVSSQ